MNIHGNTHTISWGVITMTSWASIVSAIGVFTVIPHKKTTFQRCPTNFSNNFVCCSRNVVFVTKKQIWNYLLTPDIKLAASGNLFKAKDWNIWIRYELIFQLYWQKHLLATLSGSDNLSLSTKKIWHFDAFFCNFRKIFYKLSKNIEDNGRKCKKTFCLKFPYKKATVRRMRSE